MDAEMLMETGEKEALCIGRYFDGDQILGIFNFSEHDKQVRINGTEGEYADVFTGEDRTVFGMHLPPYGFYYLKRK